MYMIEIVQIMLCVCTKSTIIYNYNVEKRKIVHDHPGSKIISLYDQMTSQTMMWGRWSGQLVPKGM